MAAPEITVFEVGPRDGLQNEKRVVPLATKLWFIQRLIQAGVREIETGAFVRSDRIPQMADSEAVYRRLSRPGVVPAGVRTWALVPNEKGLERAAAAGVRSIAIFTAATDGFALKNIGMTVEESLRVYSRLMPEAKRLGMTVRGYVSTALGCPYEGKVAPSKPIRVAGALAKLGVFQVSIGDTIGIGTPRGVSEVFGPLVRELGASRVAAHFHDTRGTALANVLRAFELGVRTFDSSAGGLGGCPYAPGATGNLATEDLVFMLEDMGIRTGIDLAALCETSLAMAKKMKRPLSSRYLAAYAAGRKRSAKSNSSRPRAKAGASAKGKR